MRESASWSINKLVTIDLTEKIILNEMMYLSQKGKKLPERGESQGKGPKVRVYVTCLLNRKEAEWN